jgi:ABC-type xylose transport system permease subunit
VILSFVLAIGLSLWHSYWIDHKNAPSSFITGITNVFLWILTTQFLTKEDLTPYNPFFYILAFNPLSDIAIYTLVTSLLLSVFVLYYLRLSSRLQHNLRTDQWIPFLILVLTGASLGIAGFLRLHTYMQFRLSFFVALIVLSSFFVMEKSTRIGRRIQTIGCEPEVAYLVGIPVKQVRRNVWILVGVLLGVASLFFRDTEVMLQSRQIYRMEGIILASGLLGHALGKKERSRIYQSFLAVALLVVLESTLNLWGAPSEMITLITLVFIFIALYLSGFKPGLVT